MSKVIGILAALGVLILGSVGWYISTGNRLLTQEEAIKGQWAQVQNTYQRRMDLIPNLVNTVKGYAKHERETLESVIRMRNQAMAPDSQAVLTQSEGIRQFQKNQDALSSALGRLMVVVERYPDLKANENFKTLMSQLEGTENRITVERKRFNEAVLDFNTSIKLFPTSFVATSKGLVAKPYFEAAVGADKAPEVKF